MKKLVKELKSLFFTFLAKRSSGNFNTSIRANGYTRLSKQTRVGNNVHFNGLIVYGKGECFIGSNFHSGYGCKIITSYHNHMGEAIPYDNTLIVKNVIIEDNVWLGINVIILGGVKIGEGAIIQAGSVVVNDIEPLGIAGGHPAKVFSCRDKEKYYSLKKERKFF
ncbi:acyltransferase [Flagellimonas beolgyonensis]|uniref:acyltransferase n=1 Tax=Flagellimonas beolgyonensis TaxID=864064 RepID=UPI000F8D6383|nr:acyltransferase [Allomuricauda beolgyonensis]